jgi:hypothetical protein
MRKPSRAGGIAVGALAAALTAGAFALAWHLSAPRAQKAR